VSQSGLTLQNLNFNLARGDLSLQLVGRTSDQIMRLSEALGAEGLQADIGTISQEEGEVRATLRLRAIQ
jgi:type II secretory pathway component PulL